MKIAVFGATGNLGHKFLKISLEKGHSIIAYARSPEKIEFDDKNLEVIKGDVFDQEKITEILKNVDGVLICWRLRTQRIPLFSQGTQNVIEGMKKNGKKRLIVMSEYAYDNHFRNSGIITKIIFKVYGKFQTFQINERRQQDEIVHQSGLEWTINRIRMLTNKSSDKPLELTLEPKPKMIRAIYRGTAAEKIFNQFENPDDFIQKEFYF